MNRIFEKRIVPAATIESLETAVPLAEALLAGGLDIIEITFRTDVAGDAMAAIAASCPDMLMGAGTVLTKGQIDRAADAGARFMVSPGFNEDLMVHSEDKGVPFIPGIITGTEIQRALAAGCKLLKFFPAEASGGVPLLKAVSAPYAHTGVKFLPTGGIHVGNARSYLSLPVVAAVGGSWMVSAELIAAGDWGRITDLATEAVSLGQT